jgi:hypothetical protein
MEWTYGKSLLLASCVLLVAALGACRNEQKGGSLLDPDPGVYKGSAVPALTPQTLAELAERAKHQEFYNVGGPK